MITQTTKPKGKKPLTNNAAEIKKQFDSVAETYGTDDPELIKQKIMWSYIHLMTKCLTQPGQHQGIEHHARHFEMCNKFIAHQSGQHEALMDNNKRRLATINTLVLELHKVFGDDYKDLCRRLTTDGSRLKYSMLYETVNELYGIIASKKR